MDVPDKEERESKDKRAHKASAEEKADEVSDEKRENATSYDEAMKACLEKRKGENSAVVRCKAIVGALMRRTNSPPSSIRKPRLVLRSGRFTDV